MRVMIALLAASVMLLSGCGYVFSGGGSTLPVDVKRIYVPMAENDTPESGLSLLVTEAMRDALEQYGVVSVVDTVRDADAVMRIRIRSVKRETRSVTSGTDTVLQMTTNLVLSGELRRVTGQVLWANPAISVARSFGTTNQVVVTSSADFASGSMNPQDLANLSSREVSRGQEQAAFEVLSTQAATLMYQQAVAADF